MAKSLSVGLPVMLHSEPEVQAFLRAKDRIEAYGDMIGQTMQVGAFLFFLPFALKDENREKQITNQSRYQIPILHAQASFQLKHNLVYSKDQDLSLNGGKDLLEIAIDQTAELKKHDPSKFPVDVDFNVGAYLCRQIPEQKPVPFIYSLDEFLSQKEELFQRSVSRFSELRQLAEQNGLGVGLENAITNVFVPHPHLKGEPPRMYTHPFNDIYSMRRISGESIILDMAHWAAGRSAPELFEKNGAHEERELLFKMEGISSWDEYRERNPDLDSYIPHSMVFHISNSTGLGVYLDKYPDLQEKWGDVGTIEGLVPRSDFHKIAQSAREDNKPVIIEVEYDVKNIPQNNYKEADPMLSYMLT
jgi:hypothetical protein